MTVTIPTPELHYGVATPQANPTVEAELRHLLSGRLLAVTTRLTSSAAAPQQRLVDYFEQIDSAVESFDSLSLSAFGFACTGSTYLVGAEAEDAAVQRLSTRFGFPVITATVALRAELELLGARRLAILAPYPDPLCNAAQRYWEAAGCEVVTLQRLETGSEDTRSIYGLTPPLVSTALRDFRGEGADLILLSGTGMPSLGAILGKTHSVPVISSNLCLAAHLRRLTGQWPTGEPADLSSMLSGDN